MLTNALAVMLTFHGRPITPHLFWVHVCLNIPNFFLFFFYFILCISTYDFPKYDFGTLTSDSWFKISKMNRQRSLQPDQNLSISH